MEGIAKIDKATSFLDRFGIDCSGKSHRLVGDDANSLTLDARETHDQATAKFLLNLKKIASINQQLDKTQHIVSSSMVLRHQGDEFTTTFLGLTRSWPRRDVRRSFPTTRGHEREETSYRRQTVSFVRCEIVRLAGLLRGYLPSAKVFARHIEPDSNFNYWRALHAEKAGPFYDWHEVGLQGREGWPAKRCAHYRGDLWDSA